jgi:hypothetical protein
VFSSLREHGGDESLQVTALSPGTHEEEPGEREPADDQREPRWDRRCRIGHTREDADADEKVQREESDEQNA